MKKRDKRFLNDSHEEFGYICWSVSTEVTYGGIVSAELSIADCSKTICLEFDCHEQKHIQKRIQKLDNMMESLHNMREALVEVQNSLKPKGLYY